VLGFGIFRSLGFVRIFPRNVVAQQRCGVFLYENFAFKFSAIDFHVLVGVSRVAIFASEFTAAIWVNGPIKWHAFRIASIQDRFHRQQEILRLGDRLFFSSELQERLRRGVLCPPVAQEESGPMAGGNPPWTVPDFAYASRVHPGHGVRSLLGQAFQGKKVGNELRGDERGGGDPLGTTPKGEELGT